MANVNIPEEVWKAMSNFTVGRASDINLEVEDFAELKPVLEYIRTKIGLHTVNVKRY